MIGGDLHQAHSCEEENLNIVAAVVRASELRTIQATVAEVTPESSTRKQSAGPFKPTKDTKVVQVNPKDTSKTVQIGCSLFDRQECKVINFLLQN
jgi:protein-disulfide isomerase